ncbi:MAG: hypothetical protein HKN13_04175, partial [Rhodothermales bacterium]|nr:hypothetical protein [Rhodothermales bacterium]
MITFDVPEPGPTKNATATWPEITPQSPLPDITLSMTIDGSKPPHSGLVTIVGKESIDRGIRIKANRVTVMGMRIKGFVAGDAIQVDGVGESTIGGSTPGAGNHLFENSTGIYVNGSGAVDNTIHGNCIGAPDCSVDLDAANEVNFQVGVYVANGPTKTRIGGLGTGEGNTILGGVIVKDDDTDQASVQQNILAVRAEQLQGLDREPLGLPFDLEGDGPSCNPWIDGDGPNDGMPPPRILELTATQVTGITKPGAVVEVYEVVESGSDRGRYFARHVKPIGHASADGSGKFTVALSLNDGDQVTLTATDVQGSTSEFSQVRRPVIFVPGVAGSTLADKFGRQRWLPARSDFFERQVEDIEEMTLYTDGKTGALNLEVTGVLEFYPVEAYKVIYGPMLNYLKTHGLVGARGNANPGTIDLWRYPYDWRKRLDETAKGLKDLVSVVTGDIDEAVARSCEVDILAHSMGGMVSGVYLNTPENEKHVQNRVHRYVSIATPYLGTPKVVGAHTMGYIFEMEKKRVLGQRLFFYSVPIPWGKIITLARNMPAAYATLPSRSYWAAAMLPGEHFLVDLDNKPLVGYDNTKKFLTANKVNASYKPQGLARHGDLWTDQESAVHGLIDDWRDRQGPPQIFRLVGQLDDSTPIGWRIDAQELAKKRVRDDYRRETSHPNPQVGITWADNKEHERYRSSLAPVLGAGDKTVAEVSATLGHSAGTGKVDFSGVGSTWIEDFEYYPCEHFQIVQETCVDQSGKKSLDRAIDILKSGYAIVPTHTSKVSTSSSPSIAHASELVYVVGSAPFDVHVEDEHGAHSGPVVIDTLRYVEYGIEDIGYWHNEVAVT